MFDLKRQLRDIGFTEKETSVYLAMLELGPSSMQDIAEKADVNRATAYLMVESLKKRGLVSSAEQGKKTLLTAETPQRLLRIMEEETRRIDERRRGLESVMPQFMALFNSIQYKPRVRFFEGEEGVTTGRDAIRDAFAKSSSIMGFIHYDKGMADLARYRESDRIRLAPYVGDVRLLYSLAEDVTLPLLPSHFKTKQILVESNPFHGELNISDSVIMLAVAQPMPMLVVIESPEFAGLLKIMFELAWNVANEAENRKAPKDVGAD
jgi:sugar-specific transcriptional regulator TrmB